MSYIVETFLGFLNVSDQLNAKDYRMIFAPFLNIICPALLYYNITATFRPGENDSDTEEINVQELNRKISSPQQPARKISPAQQGENYT